MKLIRFLLPRIEYILFAAIFWGIASTGPILLNSDGDLPRHLLVGNMIRTTWKVDVIDIFSYRTTGFPSIPHEWLSQVIFSTFFDILGLGGVVLFTALIVTITWALVYYEALRRSDSLIFSLGFTALGIGASLIHVLPRPHLFSHIFTILWVLVLEHIYRDKPQKWWLLPILMLVWVNLHGMFVLGIVIWAIYLAGDLFENPSASWLTSTRTKSMLAAGGLSFLATLLSPTGIKIWDAVASFGGNAYIKSRIPELQSADFHLPETWSFILILLLLILVFSRSTHQTRWTYVFLVASFAGVALYFSRMLPFFAIVAVPIAAQEFASWFKQDFPKSRFLAIEANINMINRSSNGVIWVIAVVLATTLLFKANIAIDPKNKGNVFDDKYFPIGAVAWLESHPQTGHMFNEFDWGGYILLKLWPTQQIFMDGHIHIFGEKLIKEYEQVLTVSNGWEAVIEKYQVTWAIVRDQSSIAKALVSDGWQILYQDPTAIILSKP